MCVYLRALGLGTLLFPSPLSPFSVLEPCFLFCPLGTPNGFCLSFLALRGILALLLFRFASRLVEQRSFCPCVNNDS